jgi:hypothetical protein
MAMARMEINTYCHLPGRTTGVILRNQWKTRTTRNFAGIPVSRHILGIGRWCIVRVLKPAERVSHGKRWSAIRPGTVPQSEPLADDGGALLAISRPGLREGVIHHVVGFDAERVLDDLGGAVGIVAADGLLDAVKSR